MTVVNVFVEIPSGSHNKYEWDHEVGGFVLDRVLFSPMYYPGDYGFIPDTLGGDGDPLDVLVLMSHPTFPGCTVPTKVLGMLDMADDKGEDQKVVGVSANDPRWADCETLEDLPAHVLREVEHFFARYKDLENKQVEIRGWRDRDAAESEIKQALANFEAADPKPAMPGQGH